MAVESALFQDPPKPLDVWMDPFSKLNQAHERTFFWKTKNFGQWCRNFTMNIHTQCLPASPFHWFVCCGKHNTECCVGIQTWIYVVFGSLLIALLLLTIFFFALHFNIILPQRKSKKTLRLDERIESLSSSSTLSTPTRLRKDIPSASTLLRFTPSPIEKRHNNATTTSSCVFCLDIGVTFASNQKKEFNKHICDCGIVNQ